MSDIQLDSLGGIAIVDGDLALVTGADEIRQELQIRLKLFRGEWFLDNRRGIDYYGTFFAIPPRIAEGHREIRTEISDTKGVIGINQYNAKADQHTGVFTIDFIADTEEGVIEVNV